VAGGHGHRTEVGWVHLTLGSYGGSCEQESAPSDLKNVLTNKTTKKFLMMSLHDVVMYIWPTLVLRRDTFQVIKRHFCAVLIFMFSKCF
jgi:hypothetical protein